MANAEVCLVRSAQRNAFTEYDLLKKKKVLPASSKLTQLLPVLDEDDVMRVTGRLQNADFLSYDEKHPIILPRSSWITKLIIRQYHEEGNHAMGTNQTWASLLTKFWIMCGREAIKECEKDCYECKRRRAKPKGQQMAPLPSSRLKQPLQAFVRSSVDYGGPFITIQGRGKRRAKRYLCLFTCLLSRAVHLEMAYSLDTNSFLNCYNRFCDRRGQPQEMLSDNGTNFVGAKRELEEIFNEASREEIKQRTKAKWQFNPPSAPHFGGVHEALVKSAKRAIYAILSEADVTDEELQTAFCGAESLLNSRPLTIPSSDARDEPPLTPNHFLTGRAGEHTSMFDGDTTKQRWRRVQLLVTHFWRRWMREFIPALNRRPKWTSEVENIKVDDVVIVVNQDTPRGQWPLGRVSKVFPGSDGKVRVVNVIVGGKTFLRPVTKLCPLVSDAK